MRLETRAQIPSRPESRRQSSGRKIQHYRKPTTSFLIRKSGRCTTSTAFTAKTCRPVVRCRPEGAGNDVNFNFDGFDFGGGSGGESEAEVSATFQLFFGGRGGNAVQEEAEAGRTSIPNRD